MRVPSFRKGLFIILLSCTIIISCSEAETPPADPPEILYFSISDRSVSYGQNVELSLTTENQDVDYDIQWYLIDEQGERETIGSGNDVVFDAPNYFGEYDISVNITDEQHSLTEEVATINVYGWAEENFVSVNSAWQVVNEAFAIVTNNGAEIGIPEGQLYGGMITETSNFVSSGQVITPPLTVVSTLELGDGFESEDYIELYLGWKDVDSYLTLRSARVRWYPEYSNEHGFWTVFTQSYNSKTDESKYANLDYSFLADSQVDIIANDLNQLKIVVNEDKLINGYINETLVCSIAVEDLILEEDQMSWELERILILTNSGITLNQVALR